MNVRRPLALATLLALALALPATASAQKSSSGVAWGFGLGMEDGDGDTGLALRADAIFPFKKLSPTVRLSWVGSGGLTYFSENDASLTILKVVPAARFSFPVAPSFELYGDVGLGLYMAFFSAGTFDDTEFSFLMRFAVGGLVTVSRGVRLGAELGLNPYFGDVDDNTFSALFVATFGY